MKTAAKAQLASSWDISHINCIAKVSRSFAERG
jgi:hypothetical protein